MNENDAYIFDVEEPKSWVFKGEPVWISGWFHSKVGAVFSDIRAVIDGVAYLGIFGHPRENIEQQYRGYCGLPHVGFSLLVRPPQGARALHLELLDAGGRWVEFWRTEINVTAGPRPGATLNAGCIPDQLLKLLKARRAAPTGDLTALARTLVRESSVVPLDTLPNPPFFGALENPHLIGGSQFGKLRVEGWIIHQDQRIRRLIATTHPLAESEMDYGTRERGEVRELFPHHPYAGKSQFFGMVDIDERAGDPVCLKVFAELEDNSRHLVFVRRFYQRGCNQWERPLPLLSRAVFVETVRTFWSACRAEGVRGGALGDFWRGCREAYDFYRRFAPATVVPHSPANADPFLAWQRANRVTPHLQQALVAVARQHDATGPRFVLLVDSRGCTPGQLQELAGSLAQQIYPHWQLWFVGEVAAPSGDPRLKSPAVTEPKDFLRALNTAAHQAPGTHLALLPGHSRLSADALVELADRLAADPALELIYTDEDRMDDAGVRTAPNFKPAWSPSLADSGLFPGQLSVVRRDRFIKLGSFRDGFDHVPWYDVLLRLSDTLRAEQVAHVPLICHHARHSTTQHCARLRKRSSNTPRTRRGWCCRVRCRGGVTSPPCTRRASPQRPLTPRRPGR